MEPIDHPPGHEIERLNREIEEQYADAEWTPASVIALVLIALPFVAFGIHVLASAGVLWQVLVISALVLSSSGFGFCFSRRSLRFPSRKPAFSIARGTIC